MPPPLPFEVLPEMVELVTVRVPLPLGHALLKAPPKPVVCAPETVTPEIDRLPPNMLKILKSRFALMVPEELSKPLMVSSVAPGPVMVRVPAETMVGRDFSTLSRVIVPVTLKSIISLALLALAVVMASLSEIPELPGAGASEVVVTVIVAGTILPSSWRS